MHSKANIWNAYDPARRTARPRVIVGNVDCEFQCGEPQRRSPQERWHSTVIAHRLLWLCNSHLDLCLFPSRIRSEMMAYASEILEIPLGEANQTTPGEAAKPPVLLTEAVMAEVNLHDSLARLGWSGSEAEVLSYFVDPGLQQLCRQNRLSFRWPDSVSLEALNRKSFFRSLAGKLGIPIAPGRICYTAGELEKGIHELLMLTGTVIVKQDLAGGGEGNIAVTVKPDASAYIGTSATYRIKRSDPITTLSSEIFERLCGIRNTCVVVESYLDTKEVIYSEVQSSHATEPPVLLNWGGMLMEPKWVGFEIPAQRLTTAVSSEFIKLSLGLGEQIGCLGYHGRMNCDAVVTQDDGLFFTEINVRLGGCTHVDVLARRILGAGYAEEYAIRTRNEVRFAGSFGELLATIGDLQFNRLSKRGAIVLTECLSELGEFECMCVGRSPGDVEGIMLGILDRVREYNRGRQ